MIRKIFSRLLEPSNTPSTSSNSTTVASQTEKTAYLHSGSEAPQSRVQCAAIVKNIYSDYQAISQVSAKTPLKKTMAPQPFVGYVAQLRALRQGLTEISERYDSLPESVAGDPALNAQAANSSFLPFVATLANGVEQLTDLCSIVAEGASDGSTTIAVQGKQLRRYTDLLRILNESDAAIDAEYKKLSRSLDV